MNRRMKKKVKMHMQNKIFRQMVAKTVREFCSNTTVHGFRYVTEANLSWIERMWWLLSIVVLIMLCTFAICNIWTGWQKRPVIVSFDDKTTSVGTIPFPAVTICSSQTFDVDKLNVSGLVARLNAFEHHESDSNLTSDEVCKTDALMHLCFITFTKIFTQISTIRPCESIYETIISIGPDASVTITDSDFNERRALFRPVFTERGLCYTFNSLNSKDIYSNEIASELLTVYQNPKPHWNIEDGYTEGIDEEELYPKRVSGTKIQDILTVHVGLWTNSEEYYCTYESNKFFFALHSPDELPRTREDFMLIQRNQDSHITVNPVLMKTSNGLRGYSPEARSCFFKQERKLRFFRAYSRNHCELECLANYTQNKCNCMPFYMPRDNTTRVCSIYDYECFKKADVEFAKSKSDEKCNCLPECFSLTYNTDSSQANIYEDKTIRENENIRRIAYSKLSILYKQSNFIALTRSETSSMTDFIASFGGLLGLFMGVSILSLVELVYYFTLRIFYKFRREKAKRIETVASARRVSRLTLANTVRGLSQKV